MVTGGRKWWYRSARNGGGRRSTRQRDMVADGRKWWYRSTMYSSCFYFLQSVGEVACPPWVCTKRPAMAGTTGPAVPPPQGRKAVEEPRSARPSVPILRQNMFAPSMK
jgi:hypothetical protein